MADATCSVDGCTKPKWARGWCSTHYRRWHQTGSPTTPSIRDPLLVRFRRFAPSRGEGCWEWEGPKDADGYGRLEADGVVYAAHRMALELVGVDCTGRFACHTCDNPGCVNPGHLYAGTHADNMRDKAARGRGVSLPGETNPFAKLTTHQVYEIRSAYAEGRATQRQLARRYGVSQSHIGRIVRSEAWTHLQGEDP